MRLIAPEFVKPYLKNQENDMADAEAITEAASRPTMGFVEVKTPGQQGLGMIFQLRDRLEASWVINRAMNRELFELYVETQLAPTDQDRQPKSTARPVI